MKSEIHSQPKLKPHKITKPIQLLAAWLLGLILVNGSLLAAAAVITQPSWVSSMLAIAAVANVPIFMIAIFLLQTKFRPEMQEDSYYHEYLKSLTGNSPIRSVPEALVAWTSADADHSINVSETSVVVKTEHPEEPIGKWAKTKVAVNKFRSDFVEILAVLKEHNIPFSETFGSAPLETLPYFQIAVGHNVEFSEIKMVVLAFANYKEGRIDLISPHEEPNELRDNILIGAYGKPSGPRLVEAQEILEKGLMSDDEFLNFIRQGNDPY